MNFEEETSHEARDTSSDGCCLGCAAGFYGVPILIALWILMSETDDAGGLLFLPICAVFFGAMGAALGWLVQRIIKTMKKNK